MGFNVNLNKLFPKKDLPSNNTKGKSSTSDGVKKNRFPSQKDSQVNNSKEKTSLNDRSLFPTKKTPSDNFERTSSQNGQNNEDWDKDIFDNPYKPNEYDKDGCIYDDKGHVISRKTKNDYEEYTTNYTYNDKGDLIEYSKYNSSGEKEETTYIKYGKNGKPSQEDTYRYSLDEAIYGPPIDDEEEKKGPVKISTKKFTYDGNKQITKETAYDYFSEEVEEYIDSVCEFGEDGKIKSKELKIYDNDGNITSEDVIQYDKDENIIYKKEKAYYPDGSVLYEEELKPDEEGKINVTSIHYSADGKIDTKTEKKLDENGYPTAEIRTEYNRDGNIRAVHENQFDEDGNLTGTLVTQYDKNNNVKSVSETKYDKNGYRISSVMTEFDEDNNITSVSESLYDENEDEVSRNEIYFDKDGNVIFEFQYEYDSELGKLKELYIRDYNQEINYTKQGSTGDCWLLSGINNLSYTENGREILQDAITYNEDGSFSIYFKGIDKSFNITEEEVKYARESGLYSQGDNDMLVLELAFEAALDKVQNNEIEIKCAHSYLTINQGEENEKSIEGGHFEDVIFMLTGRGVNATNDKSKIDKVFESMEENPGETAVQLSFSEKCKIKDIYGNDTDLISEHAYAVKSVGDDVVTIINPWNSSEEIKLSKDDFVNNTGIGIEYYNYDETDTKNFVQDISYKEDGSIDFIIEDHYEDNNLISGATIVYDGNDYVTQKIERTKDQNGNLASIVKTSYNEDGSIKTITETQFERDQYGELISKTEIEYDADGNKLPVKDT